MAGNRSGLKKTTITAIALAAMVAGFFIATILKNTGGNAPSQIQGAVLDTPRQIAVPGLTRDDGRPFTNSDLNGRWTLMFFGYTACPDICPITMNVLAEAKRQAGGEFPQVVLVSVDPERDSIDMLGEYVRYFDPDFVGVTGEEQMIQALTLQMSVVYMKMPGESGNENDYLIDHSSSILLINPEGQLAAFLKAPHTPGSINDSVAVVKAGY
jgi:protein SCO1/2